MHFFLPNVCWQMSHRMFNLKDLGSKSKCGEESLTPRPFPCVTTMNASPYLSLRGCVSQPVLPIPLRSAVLPHLAHSERELPSSHWPDSDKHGESNHLPF
ncbi:hypothetical protein M404DRAFT_849096 [Pisolithus tinctorius Marx 270]|uniref:Uncharacterized protein n=1 Tax=Pisolithus tinctorius Marx 270 TaxID=870435 RepID=A0A0C3NST0_PISTI|nr:hypothetical protein M404DRAFT_849096 [Pisolithus tinctorius Marx 270]